MRGKVRKVSLPRRLIIDLMHASTPVPFVSLSRSLNVKLVRSDGGPGLKRAVLGAPSDPL